MYPFHLLAILRPIRCSLLDIRFSSVLRPPGLQRSRNSCGIKSLWLQLCAPSRMNRFEQFQQLGGIAGRLLATRGGAKKRLRRFVPGLQ